MAILKIVKYGDDILRQKLKPVDYNQLAPQLPALLKDMEETCLAVRGVIHNILTMFKVNAPETM